MPSRATPFWIFAYGSLMWNPGFHVSDRRPAQLFGYHRALCIESWIYRGTREQPGLVLGLDRGGSCRGFALKVRGEDRDAVMAYLDERELSDGVYHAKWMRLSLDPGTTQAETTTAFTVVARHAAPQYRKPAPLHETARLIRQGHGQRGPCLDYVRATVEHLQAEGIRDHALERLLRAAMT